MNFSKLLLIISILTIFSFSFISLPKFNKNNDKEEFSQYIESKDYSEITIFDGDSFLINNNEIRLLYIDAPEFRQPCFDDNDNEYQCGIYAKEFLIKLFSKNISDSNPLRCYYNKKDKYDRFLSLCKIKLDKKLIDINPYLISSGFAINYNFGKYKYIKEEQQAREDNLGIWKYHFLPPYKYRKLIKYNKKINKRNNENK